MLFEVFVFLGDYQSHAKNTLKRSIFEIEVAPFNYAQLLNTILVLETRSN